MKCLISLSICFALASCTTIHYESRGQIPLFIGAQEGHNFHSQVYGEVEFFLWGLYPKSRSIVIDKKIQSRGIKSAANIKIREYQSFMNSFYSIISLGLYYPVNYEITSFGISSRRMDDVDLPD